MEENIKPLSEIPAINRFLSYCRIRAVPSKTVVIHAGDLPDVLYYIISGSVEVMIEDEEGNEMVLAYLNRGQFFGEMGLFYEQPTRSAWVRTRNQCELAEMTYPRFRQIAAESPGLVFELATQLATRLDRTNRKLAISPSSMSPPRGSRHHGSVRRTGRHDAPGRHADQGQPSGALAPGRLLARDGGPGAQVLEEQGLLRATGKTIVVFNARPKMKTARSSCPRSQLRRPPTRPRARSTSTTMRMMTRTTRTSSARTAAHPAAQRPGAAPERSPLHRAIWRRISG